MGKKTVLKQLLRTFGKLGKDTTKLSKALETDQGFTEDLDPDNVKYYDNPNNAESVEIEVEVEDDFVEEKDSPLG